MNPFIWLISTLISLYTWALIIYVLISLGVSFNILNPYQPFVRQVNYALSRILELALKPIRRILPSLGNIDLAPLVLILMLSFLERFILYYAW